MSVVATATEERPVFFSAAGNDLFGIVTEPTREPKGVALVFLTGGAFIPATNRNRLSVRIARSVAALGYHSLRLDYHGVGESGGEIELYRLDRPFVDDVLAAASCLRERGVPEIVLAGTCFGARTALAAAERTPGLRGVVLLAPPIRDFELDTPAGGAGPGPAPAPARQRRGLAARGRRLYRRAFRRRRRAWSAEGASPRFLDPLARLARSGTPVLLAYGTEDKFHEMRPKLAGILEVPGSQIDERIVPGRIHGLTTLAVQDAVATLIEEWLAGLDPVASPEA
jgi:pimeloyl-ACP methyl ester carboxylesterase